jgi:hypothetical protein
MATRRQEDEGLALVFGKEGAKEESSFSEEKEAKRLLSVSVEMLREKIGR